MSKFYRNSNGFWRLLTKGSGLYLLLGGSALMVVCVAALLFAPNSGEQEVSLSTDSSQSSSVETGDASDVHGADGSGSEEVENDTIVNAPVDENETVFDVAMILPVSGTVGTDFSLTVPVFSETMNDWRVHQGVDYLTEGEVEVVAVADGIVENVYTSELMGLTVEIRHEDKTLSVYQSLGGEPRVIAGQEVKQGDVLGVTGTSADSEVLVGNHLHFALIRDGIYLDPDTRFAS